MNLKRHKDIIAIEGLGNSPIAFHARNLQIAELSPEAWAAMSPASLANDEIPSVTLQSEAISELETWNESDDQDVTSGERKFGIRSLTINVTQICNLHCTYCAAGGDGTYGDPVKKISVEKTLPQIKFFMDQVPRGESFHIAFLGGEPLLYPEAIQALGEYVMTEAAARGIEASFKVTTNGTLTTAKAVQALRAIKADVVVSIDGPAEVHNRQRLDKAGRGSFDQAWAGVETLLMNRHGLGSVGVHAVFNEHNLEVEKAWDLFSESSVDFMEFTFTVDTTNSDATRIYNQRLARVAAKAWDKGGERELTRITNFAVQFRRLDLRERLENHCGIGKSLLVVDSRNQLWSCPWTVGKKGALLGTGTELNYDAIERHQSSLIERNDCGKCWARFMCGGGCSFVHASTEADGRLEKKNEFCERTRFFVALALMYYHRARTAEGTQLNEVNNGV